MSRSVPAFPFDFSNESATLLVLGSAPCLMTDLNIAKGLRPDHYLMAINDAADFCRVDYIYSFHAEKMDIFRAQQLRFGGDFTTHTHNKPRRRKSCPVDYIWDDVFHGATSAIGGAHVGMMMGFQEVILCGAPMNGGDGYFQPSAAKTNRDTPRFGLMAPKKALIRNHHQRLSEFVKIGKGRVFSMSGQSQKSLGPPPEVPRHADRH